MNKNWALKHYSHGVGNIILRFSYAHSDSNENWFKKYGSFFSLFAVFIIVLFCGAYFETEKEQIEPQNLEVVNIAFKTEEYLPPAENLPEVKGEQEQVASEISIQEDVVAEGSTAMEVKEELAANETNADQGLPEDKIEETTIDVTDSAFSKDSSNASVVKLVDRKPSVIDLQEVTEDEVEIQVNDFRRTTDVAFSRQRRRTVQSLSDPIRDLEAVVVNVARGGSSVTASMYASLPRRNYSSDTSLVEEVITENIPVSSTASQRNASSSIVESRHPVVRRGGFAASDVPVVEGVVPISKGAGHGSSVGPGTEALQRKTGRYVADIGRELKPGDTASIIVNAQKAGGVNHAADEKGISGMFSNGNGTRSIRPGDADIGISVSSVPPVSFKELPGCINITEEERLLVEIVSNLKLRHKTSSLKRLTVRSSIGVFEFSGPLHSTAIAVVVRPNEGIKLKNRCELLGFAWDSLKQSSTE